MVGIKKSFKCKVAIIFTLMKSQRLKMEIVDFVVQSFEKKKGGGGGGG